MKRSKILRRLRKKAVNRVPFQLSSRPVRYGPGRNRTVVNNDYQLAANSMGRYPLQTLIVENTEFETKKSLFKWYKIAFIRVTLYPANTNTADSIGYLNFSWDNIETNTLSIIKDDSSKVFSMYRTRSKTFKWLPVKSVLNVQSVSQDPPLVFMDPTLYNSTDLIENIPGWLWVFNPSASPLNFSYEAVVLFRANDFIDHPSKLAADTLFKNVEFESKTKPFVRGEKIEEKKIEEEKEEDEKEKSDDDEYFPSEEKLKQEETKEENAYNSFLKKVSKLSLTGKTGAEKYQLLKEAFVEMSKQFEEDIK